MENSVELLKVYEPMQSESIGKLALALSKAQGQMNGVAKGQDNPFFKSKYADLNECIQAAREHLSKNELAVIQTTELSGDNNIVIVTILAHSSGEWIKSKLKMTPKKDDDQGRGSSITYGRRYSFAAIVGLAQKDDDGNASCGNEGKGKGKSDAELKAQEFCDSFKEIIDEHIGCSVDVWTEFKASGEIEKAKKKLQRFTDLQNQIDIVVRETEKAIFEQEKN